MSRKPIFLLAASLLGTVCGQTVTHRWNFNATGPVTHGTVIPDLISGAPGTIVGTGATRNGSVLTLPGGSNGQVATSSIAAYFDLPNGIISSKTDFTLEIWATIHSNRSWQRLFDFGRMDIDGDGGGEIQNDSGNPGGTSSRDNLMLAVQRGGTLNDKRLAARHDGADEIGENATLATSLGTQYHYVATFKANADPSTGGRFTWYRDGSQIDFVGTNFPLSDIEDVNNWLGRSQWSPDQNSNISYNDVRLYDHVIPVSQITANLAAGPNAAFPAPATQPDEITLLHGQKARVAVLANDSGEISRSSLSIVDPPDFGEASVSPDGTILYTHTTGVPAEDSFVYSVANTTGQSSTATVTLDFSTSLKIPAPHLNVPDAPPATAYSLPNAFGSLTFSQPLALATPPGETQRLFVCEKGGIIKVVADVTAAAPTAGTFFNLGALVTGRSGEQFYSDGEAGLLGLAFHPDYATNRHFYVFYSVNLGGLLHQRVSRFTTRADNPNLADTTSELVLIEQRDEHNNHNGGDLHFGPADGYLYISVGDEGSGNDNPTFNSQLIDKDFFSGILRIDVDKKPGSLEPASHPNPAYYPSNPPADAVQRDNGVARYSIPADNPFVGATTYIGQSVDQPYLRAEFWATGLRNPWRMSFDPATDTLWCGDVGQGAREEIDVIVKGGNYGWVFREALLNGPRVSQHPPIPANFDTLYHDEPIYNYNRDNDDFGGRSVTGGVVYRGTRIGALQGKYIFADYESGNIWSMDLDGSNVERIAGEGGIAGFGYDPSNDDVLLADLNSGLVRRLTATTTTGTFPATLSATGLFADLSDLSPSPGLVPYDVNLPFWSDHAVKTRWVVVPDGSSQFTPSPDGLWSLTAGTIWVKHFDMEMERGNPASKRRVETRLIVKNDEGAYGVSYRWNEEQTEAFLAADSGENFTLEVTDGGNPAPQTWRIPSRAECLICHTAQAGHALSFNTRQLNLEHEMLGFSGNQLDVLHAQGFLSEDLGSPNLLPRHLRSDETDYSVEARVRSYLAVNCAYCHQDGGTAPATWDGSPDLTLTETNLVNGTANNSGGDPANKLVVPGDTAHSIVLHRIAATGGFTRMPPVGSNVIDDASVDLITGWINGELDARLTYEEWRGNEFDPEDPAGEPGEDPDNDGIANHDEFLAGTDPNNGASAFRPVVTCDPLTLGFELPANRSFRIDTTTNLDQWEPWDAPGNQGLPVAGGLMEFTLPAADPLRFFRVELQEN